MTTPQVATYALRLLIGTIRIGAGRKLPAHPFRPFTLVEFGTREFGGRRYPVSFSGEASDTFPRSAVSTR